MPADTIAALVDWLPGTWMAGVVLDYRWAWPIFESLHFCGLVMIFGAVSFVDLRVLGVFTAVSFEAVHRLIGIAVTGIAISAVTGMFFIAGTPDQYFYNAAFHWKLACLAILVLNLSYFYIVEFPRLRLLGAGDAARSAARVSAGVSLLALVGVMSAGRLLTFYRPAFIG
jgi:uncharacterized membrane protein